MPVERNYHGVRNYNEMRIDNSAPWRDKLLQTIRTNYGPATCFDQVYPVIEELIRDPTTGLTDYNLSAILYLAKRLGIDDSKIILASKLKAEGSGTDLLVSITRAMNGTAYLCGGGASGYQEDEKFAAAGLELIYQDFKHPVYRQARSAEFVPGLSVIDALMNCGFEASAALIRGA